ncbi:MAG: NAD(P)-dependent alcohol dehydrogenase [Alphaproteobacteria bacterium]|nr:NAD(P)-dependent alcohol dehydrogenase [Alphaproteobacteria bacterium]
MRVMEVSGTGYDSVRLVEQPRPEPQAGEVLVRMTAATLNYRDLMLAQGAPYRSRTGPYVPLSCGCGVVEGVGQGVTRFRAGDRVAPTFFSDWISGPSSGPLLSRALGGTVDGVAREYACFSQESLVSVPNAIGDLEAATLACAALTSWNALFVSCATKPGDYVLLQGTGGVSISGLQLAKAAGATVIITSSSDAKLERARAMGADHTINYRTTADWGVKAKAITGGRGVDVVLEVGGAETQAQSETALMPGGTIAGIGLLGGHRIKAAQGNNVRLDNIYVGSRDMFDDMNRAIAANGISPVVDRVYPLEDLAGAMRALQSGMVFGKVALQIS